MSVQVREEVFYVRVALTGPPDQMARAVRYAKEGVGRSTQSLHASLGVKTSVAVYSKGVLTSVDGRVPLDVSTLHGDADLPPAALVVEEEE